MEQLKLDCKSITIFLNYVIVWKYLYFTVLTSKFACICHKQKYEIYCNCLRY